MSRTRYFVMYIVSIALAVSAICPPRASAADPSEADLIAVLKSDSPPAKKAITCKQLAVYGSEAAVPALAPLLADEQLASWARIALEAIPHPAADEALRGAAGKLKGKLLIGVINSLGVRRDAKSADALISKLKSADAGAAAAAAEALGRIGGAGPAKALQQALGIDPPAVRSSVAYGCILCAERLAAEGKIDAAAAIYDKVRAADVPPQRRREAIRGAILARGAGGAEMLIAQLKSKDEELFGLGLRVARELPGPAVTEALVAQLARLAPKRRAMLVLALADRADPKALPAILSAVKSGPAEVRVMAMGTLERMGNASCVPVLLDAAVEADAKVAGAASSALARLPRGDVDADIAARLAKATGKKQRVLIRLAGLRRIEAATAALVECARGADGESRRAAVAALGAIGGPEQASQLAGMLKKTTDAKDREAIDKALRTICARGGAACAPRVMPLVRSGDAGVRAIALHALVCAGGPDALAAVKNAVNDKDQAVRDEAVRTLANWPNNWPDDTGVSEPLLKLAKSAKKPAHRILAIRGYLQHLQGAKKLAPAGKLAGVKQVLPLLARTEEKRLAISVLAAVPSGGALEMLAALAADRAVAEEACSAIVKLARAKGLKATKAQRRAALQTAADKARSGRTKKSAAAMLKAMR